jgi:hopanoid biosynthesis associated protein HpnK
MASSTVGGLNPASASGSATVTGSPALAGLSEEARPGKQVIITSDDFGFSREVNASVRRAHREGVLTAASLMVAGDARDEAAAIAHDSPGLDVGLHLVVCRGTSVLPARDLPKLTDANGGFPDNPVVAGMRFFFERRLRGLLRDEIRAQIELHLKLVGKLNHIDGHLNFHVHPAIADILIELAVEYRVPCLRLPREPVFTTLQLAQDNAARKLVEAVIFRALSRRTRRMMAAHGIRSTDWLYGLHQSGHLTEDYVMGVVGRLRPGLTEIYFHPAEDAGGTPPSPQAQSETNILTGGRIRAALDAAGVQLTNFAEIARPPTKVA